MFIPGENLLSHYHQLDGTIEFYGRINSLLKNTDNVLDLGAGRGSWYLTDKCSYRKELRNIKDKVKYLVGADIDEAVLKNSTTHENIIIKLEKIPLDNNSMNLIMADWVLEHVQDPIKFYSEINRVLMPGGVFCARTPHKYKYISLLTSLFKNKYHSKVLKLIQPERAELDIFPTAFKLNTQRIIKKTFYNYENFSYLYTSHPSYFANNKLLFNLLSCFHKLLPAFMVSEIFVFLKKK